MFVFVFYLDSVALSRIDNCCREDAQSSDCNLKRINSIRIAATKFYTASSRAFVFESIALFVLDRIDVETLG